jgi:hypothetical protein
MTPAGMSPAAVAAIVLTALQKVAETKLFDCPTASGRCTTLIRMDAMPAHSAVYATAIQSTSVTIAAAGSIAIATCAI